jgi:hypothetical protein
LSAPSSFSRNMAEQEAMDAFTEELFKSAYETCRELARRRERVTVKGLVNRVEAQWVTFRDGTIATWAARIVCQAPKAHLVAITHQVVDLMLDSADVYWWEPPDPEDDDECAQFTAFALATLRWIHREEAGRVPVPRYTEEEAIAWLAGKQVVQLSLWDALGLEDYSKC